MFRCRAMAAKTKEYHFGGVLHIRDSLCSIKVGRVPEKTYVEYTVRSGAIKDGESGVSQFISFINLV